MKLKITPIGNSFGVILPKETLAKLKVTGGDAVSITETPDGCCRESGWNLKVA